MGYALPNNVSIKCTVVLPEAGYGSASNNVVNLKPGLFTPEFVGAANERPALAHDAHPDSAVSNTEPPPNLSSQSKPRKKILAVDLVGLGVHWVLIAKVIEYTGYTDDAIRAKKQRGEWKEGIHWRKGPDNRLLFNLVAIQKWMGGQYA